MGLLSIQQAPPPVPRTFSDCSILAVAFPMDSTVSWHPTQRALCRPKRLPSIACNRTPFTLSRWLSMTSRGKLTLSAASGMASPGTASGQLPVPDPARRATSARASCRCAPGASSGTGRPASATGSCCWRPSWIRPASTGPSTAPRTGSRPGSRGASSATDGATSPTSVRSGCSCFRCPARRGPGSAPSASIPGCSMECPG